jgi:FKBP-type peptidyl-prolyl cis-trans isomerase
MARSPLRSFFVLLLLGAALLTLALVVRSGIAARKNPGRPINKYMREAMDANAMPQLTTEEEREIERRFPGLRTLPSGLRYVLRRAGDGPRARPGQELVVNYDGRLLTGGKFDSSYDKGVPFTFRVANGEVIKGWDEAFLEMKKGEKRTLIIPYWLAYGENGRMPLIPGRAILVFEVELIDIR